VLWVLGGPFFHFGHLGAFLLSIGLFFLISWVPKIVLLFLILFGNSRCGVLFFPFFGGRSFGAFSVFGGFFHFAPFNFGLCGPLGDFTLFSPFLGSQYLYDVETPF